jgi:hypothetical protein
MSGPWKGPWKCEKCGGIYTYTEKLTSLIGSPGGKQHWNGANYCDGELLPHDRRAPNPLLPLVQELRDMLKTLRDKCEEIRHRLFRLSDLHDNMDHWLKMDEMNVELMKATDGTEKVLARADAAIKQEESK